MSKYTRVYLFILDFYRLELDLDPDGNGGVRGFFAVTPDWEPEPYYSIGADINVITDLRREFNPDYV